MWEEFGWRGYAQPVLQEQYSMLQSSLIIGAFEISWHWPHLIVKDSQILKNFGNLGYFILFTFLFALFIGWIYNKAGGNCFITSLFHATVNGANMLLFTNGGLEGNAIMIVYLPILIIATLSAYINFAKCKKPPILIKFTEIFEEIMCIPINTNQKKDDKIEN